MSSGHHEDDAGDDYNDQDQQCNKANILLPGFLLQFIRIFNVLVRRSHVLICLHQLVRYHIQILSLLFHQCSHIIHKLIDAVGRLFNLINHFVLFQHDLPLNLIIDLDLFLCDQG